jgi:hypothetical protein
MRTALHRAKQSLQRAQDRQKTLADQHRREETYTAGQLVLLSTKNLSVQVGQKKKLLPRWVGPFAVKFMIGPVAAELELPDDWKIHPVFHVSLLKSYKSDGTCHPVVPSGYELLGSDSMTIERILDHRVKHVPRHAPVTEYLCKWLNRDVMHSTWESVSNMGEQAIALIEVYETSLSAGPVPMHIEPDLSVPVAAPEPLGPVPIMGLDLFDD